VPCVTLGARRFCILLLARPVRAYRVGEVKVLSELPFFDVFSPEASAGRLNRLGVKRSDQNHLSLDCSIRFPSCSTLLRGYLARDTRPRQSIVVALGLFGTCPPLEEAWLAMDAERGARRATVESLELATLQLEGGVQLGVLVDGRAGDLTLHAFGYGRALGFDRAPPQWLVQIKDGHSRREMGRPLHQGAAFVTRKGRERRPPGSARQAVSDSSFSPLARMP